MSNPDFSIRVDKHVTDLAADGDVSIAGNLNVGGNTTIAGDIAINGCDITTTCMAFNFLPTTATAVHIALAGTTVKIGAINDGRTEIRNQLRGSTVFQPPAIVNATPTDATVSLALTANTFYTPSLSTDSDFTLPSAATGEAGDFITVFYSAVINNGQTHSYTCTTDTSFTVGSTLTRVGGTVTSAVDVSIVGDNAVSIAGTTNGDGGIGTTVKFVNRTGALNGWSAEVVVLNQGLGSAAIAGGTQFS